MNPDVALKAMIVIGAFVLFAGWLFIPSGDIYDVDFYEDEDADS